MPRFKDPKAALLAQKEAMKKQEDARKKRLAVIDAKLREVERKEATKRQLKWGRILDRLGILQLDDALVKEVLSWAYAHVRDHAGLAERRDEIERECAALGIGRVSED